MEVSHILGEVEGVAVYILPDFPLNPFLMDEVPSGKAKACFCWPALIWKSLVPYS